MKTPSLSVILCVVAIWLAACTSVQTQTAEPRVSFASPTPSTTPEPTPTAWPSPEQAAIAAPTPTPAHVPEKASPRHSYNSIHTSKRVLAMTFDDGPHPTLTPKLLDLLKARNIKATFYVVGRNAEQYPEIMRRIVEEGHEVANHTWNHPALTKCSAGKIASEVGRTSDVITRTTGKAPTNMRPPYGAINAAITKRLNEEFGLTVVMWSVDPLDWKRPGPSVVAKRIIDGAHPGAIILSHDIHPGTIEAMPRALDELKARGYEFVTVSELLAMDEPAPSPTPKASPVPTATPTPMPEPTPEATPVSLFPSPSPTL